MIVRPALSPTTPLYALSPTTPLYALSPATALSALMSSRWLMVVGLAHFDHSPVFSSLLLSPSRFPVQPLLVSKLSENHHRPNQQLYRLYDNHRENVWARAIVCNPYDQNRKLWNVLKCPHDAEPDEACFEIGFHELFVDSEIICSDAAEDRDMRQDETLVINIVHSCLVHQSDRAQKMVPSAEVD